MRILIFDNYDSFTYNLVHLLEQLDADITVVRNDEVALEDIAAYDRVLLSPGPGLPADAGLLMPLLENYAASKKIMGVCLGMQAMVEQAGGRLTNLSQVQHGVVTPIEVKAVETGLFDQLPAQIDVGRYHSWAVHQDDLPETYMATAVDEHGYVMAIQHKTKPWCGVQFHPESVMTPLGKEIMENWLKM